MNVLAIDTSSEAMGIAIRREDGKQILISVNLGLQHATQLLPWIDKALKQGELAPEEIQLVVSTIGPGSFTGLRIGLSTAKGFAMGINAPIVGVSTLEAMAAPFPFFQGAVVPVIDARKKRIYTAIFEKGQPRETDLDIPLSELAEKLRNYSRVLLTGHKAPALLPLVRGSELDPCYRESKVATLIDLGISKFKAEGPGGDTLSPVYLRKSEAEIVKYGE